VEQDPNTGVQDPALSSAQSIQRDPDWTFVQPSPQSSAAADVEAAARGVDGVHVSGEASTAGASAADPRIQEAVEKMLAMGYSNNGGWVTSLLIACNGDINSALDVIKQQK